MEFSKLHSSFEKNLLQLNLTGAAAGSISRSDRSPIDSAALEPKLIGDGDFAAPRLLVSLATVFHPLPVRLPRLSGAI